MSRTAVIDNVSLVYLTHLHQRKAFFHYLSNLFYTVYFPSKVISEYSVGLAKEPHRNWILQRLNTEQGFYRLCTSYDSFVMVAVEYFQGIDEGEAEVYAQMKKVNAHVIISDDKKFIKALYQLDSHVKVYTTLHLLCLLEHSKLIPEWNILIKQLHEIKKFNSGELREAYMEIAQWLGLNIKKRTISSKCSLTKIL